MLVFCQISAQEAIGLPGSQTGNFWMIASDSLLPETKPGVKIIRVWDSGHWVVCSDASTINRLIPSAFRLQNNQWKLLRDTKIPEHAAVTMVQVTEKDPFIHWLREELSDWRSTTDDNGLRYTFYELGHAEMQRLLDCPLVEALDFKTSLPAPENSLEEFDLNVNRVNVLQALDTSLHGNRMVLALKETLMDTLDIDLAGRYIRSGDESDFVANHATIMTTIAAGAGNSQPFSTGVAPQAYFTGFDFTNPLPDKTSSLVQAGTSVENHSYGFGIDNRYGIEAQAYDQQIRDWPEIVHVASVGNEGLNNSTDGKYAGIPGYATVSSGFKMAKNVITVGAVDSFGIPLPRNSQGPAYDGRIKPDLMAFGNDGSSGAAALTSGVVLLLQEWYLNHFGVLPDNALIRAVLLESAYDIGTRGPDFITGYGMLHAADALQILMDKAYFGDVLAPGSVKTMAIRVDSGAQQLKVTLAWIDAPGILLADTALVADLDIEVVGPDGTVFLPWVLSSFPSTDSLELPARRGMDHLNPQEQITVDHPQVGNYQIRISASKLVSDQTFAVAWNADSSAEFEWTYPTAHVSLPAGQPVLLRWDAREPGNGQLSYRLSHDSIWQETADGITLEQNGYRWMVPDDEGWIQWRMTIGDDTILTQWVHLYQALNLKTGFLCEDSVLLHWNQDPAAMNYTIYSWTGENLEPILITPDTSIVIPVDDGRFAVQANFGDAPGVRSPTMNSFVQGVGCYINNFLADLIGETVRLQAVLGSLYGVSSLQFQKWDGKQFQTLSTVDPVLLFENLTEDALLDEGENTYRVLLTLNNGDTITSEEQTIYYLPASAFYVYPNPVSADDYLYIDRGNDAIIQCMIYDMQGREVYRDILYDQYDSIWMGRFTSGVYYYRLIDEEGRVKEGKLVVF